MSDPVEPARDPTPAAEDRVARARSRRAKAADEDDLAPRLPRGTGFKIGKGHLIKIVLTASLLVMLIVIQRPCANAVSSFVTGFDDQAADKAKMPKPGTVDGSGAGTPRYEPLKDNLTEDEWKAAIARSKARNGQPTASDGAGSGSGVGSGAGSGSGPGTASRAGSGSGPGTASGVGSGAGSGSGAR